MATYDLVLYGATGFTGRQAAHYLAETAPSGLSWAVAGRNRAKLQRVAEAAGAHGTVVADSDHPESVIEMVQGARVVATTAGPFSRAGTPVARACAERGAAYVDITGETPWVRDLIDRYHDLAAERGVRIVPFCGFDSVPSDLGTLLLVDRFRREYGEAAQRVSASFRARGGLNGGTLSTILTLAERGELKRVVSDPYLLTPETRDDAIARIRERRGVRWDADRNAYLAPFFMAPINTRVVRRSAALAALAGEPYGADFEYEEALETSRRAVARAAQVGTRALPAMAGSRMGRAALRALGPAPGEGPSERTMENGFFRARFVGTSETGRKLMATIERRGDPGNRVTVALLCEAALLLATSDPGVLPGGAERGGILTPASALGMPLVERLRRARFEIGLEPLPS